MSFLKNLFRALQAPDGGAMPSTRNYGRRRVGRVAGRRRMEYVDNMNRKRCESRPHADAVRMDLRGRGKRHVMRFSEQIGGKMVWFVEWSR